MIVAARKPLSFDHLALRVFTGLLSLVLMTLPALPAAAAITRQQPEDTARINQTDEQGMKQGPWKKCFENGRVMYTGCFKDDHPVGEFIRYDENGNLKAVMHHAKNGSSVQAELYFPNGEIAAEGKYENEKKDSLWEYYSYYTGTLSYEERYNRGLKEGVSKKYYPDGQVSESIHWKQGTKSGPWKQFYQDGTIRLTASYTDGKLNGPYKVYGTSGNLLISGTYRDNLMEGTWTYYNHDGSVQYQLEYTGGKARNEEFLEEKEEKFFEELEKNLGKFGEPDLESIQPQKRAN